MNPRIALVSSLVLIILLLTSFLLLLLFVPISLFDSFWVFLILFFLNFLLQWWLYRRISELEDDTENSNWLRIPAKVLLLLIPAFYIFGTIALLVMLAMYIAGRLWGG